MNCIVPSGQTNAFDPNSGTGLGLSLLALPQSFDCDTDSSDRTYGELNQVLIQCNQKIGNFSERFLVEDNAPTFQNVEATLLTDSSFLLKFDTIRDDGMYTIKLSSLVSNNGDPIKRNAVNVFIDNEFPTFRIPATDSISDYSFFSNRYWDFEFNEDIDGFSLPKITGPAASSVFLRSFQRLSSRSFRVFFETNFVNNNPSFINLSFPGARDKVGNPVTNSLTIQLIGMSPGPNINRPRSEFEPIINSDGDIVLIYGDHSSIEVLRHGGTEFQVINDNLPPLTRGERSILADDRNILVIGGRNSPELDSKRELYSVDSKTGVARLVGLMNERRASHSITKLLDGRILITGGISHFIDPPSPSFSFFSHNTAEIYDPTNETFSTNIAMRSVRAYHCSVTLNSGRVFIAGGVQFNFAPLDTTEFFDPSTNSFSSGPALPIPLAVHKCLKLSDGNVLIYGAQLSNFNNSVLFYDTNRNEVRILTNPSLWREWSVALELSDGGILFNGGGFRYALSEPSRLIQKLDYGKSNSMLDLGRDTKSIFRHGGIKLSDGSLFFVGGVAEQGYSYRSQFYGQTR